MKTIIRNSDNYSLWIFEDSEIVNILENCTEIGYPVIHKILDCNSSNISLVEGVTIPEDWSGCKYTFDGNSWELSQEWIDSQPIVEEPITE